MHTQYFLSRRLGLLWPPGVTLAKTAFLITSFWKNARINIQYLQRPGDSPQMPLLLEGSEPQPNAGFLGPTWDNISQTVPQPVQPRWHGSRLWTADRHTHRTSLCMTGLDHTRIIKYHTLKYVRIIKKIKYAHDTRIITQVGKNASLRTSSRRPTVFCRCVICYISKATTLHSAVT